MRNRANASENGVPALLFQPSDKPMPWPWCHKKTCRPIRKRSCRFSLIRVGIFSSSTSPSSPAIWSARPRAIGDHRRVGLPRRFAAEHFLFQDTITREFVIVARGSCPLVIDTTKAPGRTHSGSMTGERVLVAMLTIGACSTAARGLFTASTSMPKPNAHFLGEALAMRFGRTQNFDFVQRRQSPANRQKLTACLAPAAR